MTAEELETAALVRLAGFTRGAVLSRQFRWLVRSLAMYFALDRRSPYPLHKGLMISGDVGTGKTTLFRAFDLTHPYFIGGELLSEENVLPYRIVSCNTIARCYVNKDKGGVGCLEPYFSGNWMFDDLGTEDTARYYGRNMDVMGEIIQERYNRFPFSRSFFTTNLTRNDIEGTYGLRVASRLKEMCSWIDIGESVDHRR